MKHNTEQYYRARAEEYEKIYFRDVPERRREIDDEAIRLQELARGKSILELACGTGYWTQLMSVTAREITAVDLSPEMIVEAKKKKLLCPVTFIEANMFEHHYPPHAYDLVAVGFWFSHQPRQNYDLFFRLLERTVARDGLIWTIDNNPPAEGSAHETAGYDEHGNNYKTSRLENGNEFVILKNYFTEKELEAIFSPRFQIRKSIYKTYYWSLLLSGRGVSI